MNRIYLDYAATTPLDPIVRQKMEPFFSEEFGNSSSIHTWGQKAEYALEDARESVAASLCCDPDEIIFTSGGSESDNLAIRGVALMRRKITGANRILISPVEHPAVQETARQLRDDFSFNVEFIPVDEFGTVIPGELKRLINKNTAVVSIIYANNEIGTINPVMEISEICRELEVPFHTDAVQAAAHIPLNIKQSAIDLLSIGAHKFYGPKGVGALFIREGLDLLPLQTGGKQERSLRAGTHNIAYIVGLAEALRQTNENLVENTKKVTTLRDLLIEGVINTIPDSKLTGHPKDRLPNHASFVFKNIDGNALLMVLDQHGFACSSGSACKVGDPKPSEVLVNLGITSVWASGSLRDTLGRKSTLEEIQKLLNILPGLIQSLRQ
jgi:cysteine desulfurase